MEPDWKALAPHRPLSPGDAAYVSPPASSAERIAGWIAAGGSSTVLLGGPVGVGKSTELSRAAALLQPARAACLVPLDQMANMRRIGGDEARDLITRRVADLALRVWGLDLSDGLREALVSRGLAEPDVLRSQGGGSIEVSSSDLMDLTLREVARRSAQGRVCLLVDGLEKCPEPVGREVFDALAHLDDQVDLVVVVPWYAAFGPGADTAIRPGERLVSVRAPEVAEGKAGEDGRRFLRAVLAHRLGAPVSAFDRTTSGGREAMAWLRGPLPADLPVLVDTAATHSGGIPRTFLQILADAATYARLGRGASWPDAEGLGDALADQRDSVRRILVPGDKERMRDADGTDGSELDLGAKIRLMAHGLLLEREGVGGPVLRPHPLVVPLLQASLHA